MGGGELEEYWEEVKIKEEEEEQMIDEKRRV